MKVLNGLCVFVAASISLFAQQPTSSPVVSAANAPSQTTPQNSASGKGRQISLDVAVTDKSGKPQTGLQQEDFTLLDNKTPQKIQSFSAVNQLTVNADLPIEVILLIDTMNTDSDSISDARLQIEKYLRHNGGKLAYPTSIAAFSDSGLKMSGTPSLDGNALIASLKATKDIGLRSLRATAGRSGDSDRFVASITGLNALVASQSKVPGRKLVIWFSSGWPLLIGTEVSMSLKTKQYLFASVVAASEALRRFHITLYEIDPNNTLGGANRSAKFSYLSFVKGVSSAGDVSPTNLSLQVLATQSGGKVLINSNDIASEIQTCVDDANAFYVLSFDRVISERPDQYHSLEFKLNKPGLTVRTTTGYYTQP
ncbi:MAG TPA: VWA domain-containing protein [Edaphobacter sp.]|jgi:VWFA-related protein|nr:VWA domain-containing protein [Edaphobacter sp.]